MKRAFSIVVLWFLVSGTSYAIDSIEFDGETYLKKNQEQNDVFQLAEYVRNNDNLKQWYKLIAIRNFIGLTEPGAAANGLAKKVTEKNKDARPRVFINDKAGEAAVVFVTFPDDLEFVEFNVLRYKKCTSCVGLVSYQFAYRVYNGEASELDLEEFKKNQPHWRNEFLKAEFKYPFSK